MKKTILAANNAVTPPTSQCEDQKVYSDIRGVINTLKHIDNGRAIDGETMLFLIKELGFDQFLSEYYTQKAG